MGCYSSLKATVRKTLVKIHINNENEDSGEAGVVQRPPVSIVEAHDDGASACSTTSRGFGFAPAFITDSERIGHRNPWLEPWPSWMPKPKPKPKPLHTVWGILTKALKIAFWPFRITINIAVKPIRVVIGIRADLKFSHDNCIFKGPNLSEHSDSVLYRTSLNRIAKFGCCSLCESIAGTIRSEFPILSSKSPSMEVVVWSTGWGDLKANEANTTIVAQAFQKGGIFLTRG